MLTAVFLFFLSASLVDGLPEYRHITRRNSNRTTVKDEEVKKGKSRWSFSWPYSENGECVCHEGPHGDYATKDECLVAFSHSPSEYCMYEGHVGLSVEDCYFAVSKVDGVFNTECTDICMDLIRNGEFYDKFHSTCSFERVYIHDGMVLPESNCYNNIIYGHSDASFNLSLSLDEKDLKSAIAGGGIFTDVYTAAGCQTLCQKESSCVNWVWRRLPIPLGGTNSLPPFSCFLKSEENVYGSAMISMTPALSSLPSLEDPGWSYCDFRSVNYPEVRDRPQFLQCDCDPICAWNSPYHVAGPKNCAAPLSCCNPPLQPPPPPPSVSTETPSSTSAMDSVTVTAHSSSTLMSASILENLTTAVIIVTHEVSLEDGETVVTRTTELPLKSLLTSSIPLTSTATSEEICETVCYPKKILAASS